MIDTFKYMAGVVGPDIEVEESDYDPHHHRKVDKPTSYMDTMVHLLKGSIGAGILAMPDAASRVGLVAAVVGVIIIGFLATYCIQLLIAAQYQLCKRWKAGYMAYPKSMRLALQDGPPCLRWSGPLFNFFVYWVLIVWQLGICVVYSVFIASNIKQVCDNYDLVVSLRMHMCYLLPPLLIVSMVKDLKLLTPLSTISNVIIMFGLILVFFYLIEDDMTIEPDTIGMKSLEGIPVFVGITLFALEAVGVVLALEYNMEKPKDFVGLFGLFNVGMLIIMTLYALVGLFGYAKYGSQVQASITLNLPQDQKKAQAAKLIFATAIFLSFPLQNFVAYTNIWMKLKKKLAPNKHVCVDYSLRVALVIIPWSLAMAVPTLGPFISLFGAFCLSLLGVVFPGLMDACLWYPNRYGFCHYKLLRDVIIIVVGVVALVSGCYTSIIEIYEAMH